MLKFLIACSAILCLLTACRGSTLPVPTPTIQYQVAGTSEIMIAVLIAPTDSTDRDGITSIARYLCNNKDYCYVYFWDDPLFVAVTLPLMDVQEEELVARYEQNKTTNYKALLMCRLGE